MKKTYQIGGMSCSACASAVERILKRMDGVTSAQVNLVLEDRPYDAAGHGAGPGKRLGMLF